MGSGPPPFGFPFFKCYGTEDKYVIWCLRYDVENLQKIIRCYDKKDDEANHAPTEMIYWI